MEMKKSSRTTSPGEGSSQVDLELGSRRVSGATLKNKIMERIPTATASNSRRPSIWRVHPLLRNVDAKA